MMPKQQRLAGQHVASDSAGASQDIPTGEPGLALSLSLLRWPGRGALSEWCGEFRTNGEIGAAADYEIVAVIAAPAQLQGKCNCALLAPNCKLLLCVSFMFQLHAGDTNVKR